MAQAFLIGGNGTTMPSGGNPGEVLAKIDERDYHVEWKAVIPPYGPEQNGKVLQVKTEEEQTKVDWGDGLPDYSQASAGQALVLTSEGGAITPSWTEATPLYGNEDIGKVLYVANQTGKAKPVWQNLQDAEGLTVYNSDRINVKVDDDSGDKIYVVGVKKEFGLSGDMAFQARDVYAATENSTGTENQNGIYFKQSTGVLMGAAWNDYAECRQGDAAIKPGMCVIENGDDTLVLSDSFGRGDAYIVSDTYGMAIGETDSAKLPVAISGRVLAYTTEDREEYKTNIGMPVCSDDNGKVCLMGWSRAQLAPWSIIGVVASVPEYETWNGVKVDGRVWIKVK